MNATMTLEELGRYVVTLPGWGWMPGTLRVYAKKKSRVTEATQIVHGSPYPDLSDPATLGCVLAIARRALEDPGLYVHCRRGPLTMTGQSTSWFARFSDGMSAHAGGMPTEAHALVAAIAAAASAKVPA